MKKLYTLSVALLLVGGAMWAQRNVTFQVDMTGQTVDPNGVHIAGNFQDTAGFPGNWDPAATSLSQVGMTNVYEVTVSIPDGAYEFKFINGNAWGNDESVPAESQVSLGKGYDNGNGNRYAIISGDTTLPAVEYAGNAPAGQENVTLLVDMSQQTAVSDTVSVAGAFQGWAPGESIMTDYLGDSLYRYVAYLPSGDTTQFKYVNGSAWGNDESVPTTCAVGGNRQLIASMDTVAGPICFGQCSACFIPDTFNVTLQVDMSAVCGFDPATDTVDIGGPFNGWPGGFSGDQLTDPDNDLVYTISKDFAGPQFKYKARYIDSGSAVYEGGSDKVVTISSDTTIGVRCFGLDTLGACAPKPPNADITFEVDMANGPSNFVKVYLIAEFTNPPWQGGKIEMSPSTATPGVFTTTVQDVCPGRFNYKFMIEDGSANEIEEDFAGITDSSCIEPSGAGGYNRFYTRTNGQPQTLSAPWNRCATASISEVAEMNFQVYPNPFQNKATVELPSGAYQVSVYNLTGQEVWSANEVENKILLTQQNLGTGVFLIQITDKQGRQATRKVLVR